MNHDHTHAHAHAHQPANFDRAFTIGIALNLGFVLLEAFYGWQVNSLALRNRPPNPSPRFFQIAAWCAPVLI